jgi:hypothetical protein
MMAPEYQPSDSRQVQFLATEDSAAVSVEHTKVTDTKRIYLGTYKRWIWGSILALCCLAPMAAFIRASGQQAAHGKPMGLGRHAAVDNLRRHSAFIPAPRAGSLTAAQSETAMNVYVPDGMSREEYAKIKKKEAYKGKNLGASGPRGYKSRSFNDFVSQLENGDPNAKNLPMFFAKEKLARGEITMKDIPYMQRGGAYDGSDLETGPIAFLKKAFKPKEKPESTGEDFKKLKEGSSAYNSRMFGAVDRVNNAPKIDFSKNNVVKNDAVKTENKRPNIFR